MASIDGAQRWWDSVAADLKLRRGQSGKRLLEIAGDVGDSPQKLLAAVERLQVVLGDWVNEGQAPLWAVRIHRMAKRHIAVLRLVETGS